MQQPKRPVVQITKSSKRSRKGVFGQCLRITCSLTNTHIHTHTHTYRYTHVCLYMELSLQSFQMLLPLRLLLLLKPLAQGQHQSFVRPAEPRCDTFVASTARVCVCMCVQPMRPSVILSSGLGPLHG